MIDPLAYADIDWDCLGCVQQALYSGVISQEVYDDFFDTLKAMESAKWGTCPGCGDKRAYISEYEPNVMHCGACGLYSHWVGIGWQPLRQGQPMPDISGILARRAARRAAEGGQEIVQQSPEGLPPSQEGSGPAGS